MCGDLEKSHFSETMGTQAHWSGLKREQWGDERVGSCWDGEQRNRMLAGRQ